MHCKLDVFPATTTHFKIFLFRLIDNINQSVIVVFKKFTRSKFNCPLFGHPMEYSVNKLPTYKEVLKCGFYENYKLALK